MLSAQPGRIARSLAGLMIVSLLVISCTGGTEPEDASPAELEISVVASEWKYEPADIQAPVGKTVRLVLENKGAIQHNIAIKELAFVVDAGPKQTRGKNLTLKKAGEYRLICSLPGHAEAGMVGTLTVTESTVGAP